MKQQKAYVRISDVELDRVAELQGLGYGVSKIAAELGRAKSSISELIAINKDKRGGIFRANLAARRRTERKQLQRKKVKLETNEVCWWSTLRRGSVSLSAYFCICHLSSSSKV